VRVLGLSLVIIGLLLMNLVFELLYYVPWDEDTFMRYIIYCVIIMTVGVCITVAGYVRPRNKPLTEERMEEILRSEEFNTTEILYRILVEQKDS
jgi:hypothetical protein